MAYTSGREANTQQKQLQRRQATALRVSLQPFQPPAAAAPGRARRCRGCAGTHGCRRSDVQAPSAAKSAGATPPQRRRPRARRSGGARHVAPLPARNRWAARPARPPLLQPGLRAAPPGAAAPSAAAGSPPTSASAARCSSSCRCRRRCCRAVSTCSGCRLCPTSQPATTQMAAPSAGAPVLRGNTADSSRHRLLAGVAPLPSAAPAAAAGPGAPASCCSCLGRHCSRPLPEGDAPLPAPAPLPLLELPCRAAAIAA